VIELQKDDISKNLEKINSAVKFGTSIKANADILSAEIIRIDIQLIDIDEAVNSALKMLSELIGRNVTPLTALIFPEISDGMINSENKRPEMSFYDLQQSVLEANGSLVATQRYPRVFGFGEAGYGRPGLNMLSNRFDSFWLIGGKITWNIWVWNQTSKQRKIIDLQKNIINTQKETFDKNLKISQNTYIADISRYSEMIKKDAEVIKLREEILKAGSSQLLNGIISSTDFVIQENDLAMAKINLENHKLQLAYAKINYLTNLGQ
jgi:outer membrane protein TolC